jgi:hypothetical protein
MDFLHLSISAVEHIFIIGFGIKIAIDNLLAVIGEDNLAN